MGSCAEKNDFCILDKCSDLLQGLAFNVFSEAYANSDGSLENAAFVKETARLVVKKCLKSPVFEIGMATAGDENAAAFKKMTVLNFLDAAIWNGSAGCDDGISDEERAKNKAKAAVMEEVAKILKKKLEV